MGYFITFFDIANAWNSFTLDVLGKDILTIQQYKIPRKRRYSVLKNNQTKLIGTLPTWYHPPVTWRIFGKELIYINGYIELKIEFGTRFAPHALTNIFLPVNFYIIQPDNSVKDKQSFSCVLSKLQWFNTFFFV